MYRSMDRCIDLSFYLFILEGNLRVLSKSSLSARPGSWCRGADANRSLNATFAKPMPIVSRCLLLPLGWCWSRWGAEGSGPKSLK